MAFSSDLSLEALESGYQARRAGRLEEDEEPEPAELDPLQALEASYQARRAAKAAPFRAHVAAQPRPPYGGPGPAAAVPPQPPSAAIRRPPTDAELRTQPLAPAIAPPPQSVGALYGPEVDELSGLRPGSPLVQPPPSSQILAGRIPVTADILRPPRVREQPSLRAAVPAVSRPLESIAEFLGLASPESRRQTEAARATAEIAARERGETPAEFREAALGRQRAGERAIKGVARGVLGTAGAITGAVPWLEALLGVTTPVGAAADELNEFFERKIEDLQPSDPAFPDRLAEGFGSMALFLIPSIGTAAGIARVAALVPRMAKILGLVQATVMEALAEAGDSYRNLRRSGASPEAASQAAAKVFGSNLVLIGVTNRFGIFADAGSAAVKASKSALMEGAQEFGQQIIQDVPAGRGVRVGESLEAGAVGAIVGGGTGLALRALERRGAQGASEAAPPEAPTAALEVPPQAPAVPVAPPAAPERALGDQTFREESSRPDEAAALRDFIARRAEERLGEPSATAPMETLAESAARRRAEATVAIRGRVQRPEAPVAVPQRPVGEEFRPGAAPRAISEEEAAREPARLPVPAPLARALETTGPAEGLDPTDPAQLSRFVRSQGGIAPSPTGDLMGEYRAIPPSVKNRRGVSPDLMAQAVSEAAGRPVSDAELLGLLGRKGRLAAEAQARARAETAAPERQAQVEQEARDLAALPEEEKVRRITAMTGMTEDEARQTLARPMPEPAEPVEAEPVRLGTDPVAILERGSAAPPESAEHRTALELGDALSEWIDVAGGVAAARQRAEREVLTPGRRGVTPLVLTPAEQRAILDYAFPAAAQPEPAGLPGARRPDVAPPAPAQAPRRAEAPGPALGGLERAGEAPAVAPGTVEEPRKEYGAGNPFAERAITSRAKYERLVAPSQRDRDMEQAFPLGTGYGRKGGEQRIERTINRAVEAEQARTDAEYYEAQAAAFDRGDIDAQGRATSPERRQKSDARRVANERRDARIATAKELRGDKPAWQVPAWAWADSSGYLSGNGRSLVLHEHRLAVEEALESGNSVPADVLADYPDLRGPKYERTALGDQALIPGAEGREIPTTPLRPEVAQRPVSETPLFRTEPEAEQPRLPGVEEERPAFRRAEEPRKPYRITSKEELENLEFQVPSAGASLTPKRAFRIRASGEFETLADLARQEDQWRFEEALGGKGWERTTGIPASLNLAEAIKRGEPITVYRAVKPEMPKGILPGAYVTESRRYAERHAEAVLHGSYEIESLRVPPDELMVYGDPHEFIYLPKDAETAFQRLRGSQARRPAPARFVFYQEGGREPLAQYALTEDIPGHPRESTVSPETLREAGYEVPETPSFEAWQRTRGVGEEPARYEAPAPPFFSQLQRVIEQKMPERAFAPQVEAIVRAGAVKAEEVKWTGLDDWLRAQGGRKVTKAEVLDFLRQNEVRVEEVTRGESRGRMSWLEFSPDSWQGQSGGQDQPYFIERLQNDRYLMRSRGSGLQHSFETFEQAVDQAETYRRNAGEDVVPTKFARHTLPGAAPGTYRELLLTLPSREKPLPPLTELPSGYEVGVDDQQQDSRRYHILPPGQVHARPFYGRYASREEAIEGALDELNRRRQEAPRRAMRIEGLETDLADAERALEEYQRANPGAVPARDARLAELTRRRDNAGTTLSLARESGDREGEAATYRSPHFDEPNVLAHVRFNERTDAQGKRVLFIEELQSDLAQGRRRQRQRIDAEFDGIVERMKSAGRLVVECD